MNTRLSFALFLLSALLVGSARCGDDEIVLCDFEVPKGSLIGMEKLEFVADHATQGKSCGRAKLDKLFAFELHVAPNKNGGGRWPEFDQLVMDVYIDGGPANISGFVTDAKTHATPNKGWFLRHNFNLKRLPGKHRITFPVGGMTRQDGSGCLDPKTIDFLALAVASDDPKNPATIYMDNLRLVKGSGGCEIKMLYSFEGADAGKYILEDWPENFAGKSLMSVVEEHAGHGTKALKLESHSPAGNVQFSGFDGDWSSYDTLAIDIFSTADKPHSINGWIRDDPKADWMHRHNFDRVIKPGFNSVKFSIGGIRNQENAPKLIDAKKIACFNISAGEKTIFIDNIRLIKGVEEVPVKGLQKFDFGPETSAVFPGFKAVTMKDAYSKEKGWGWAPGSSLGRAFDINEILGRHRPPDDICRDFISPLRATFLADVPDGKYGAWLMMGPPGNGWAPTFKHRTVTANGKVVLDQSFDKDSFKEHEFHFQDTEDLPGDDIWERYINYYFKPVVFDVDVTDGKISIDFDAHGQAWCAMVNGLVVWPKASEGDAVRWIANLNDQRREQFYANHFEETAKVASTYVKNDQDEKRGYARFVCSNQETLAPNFVPSAEHLARTAFDVVAAQGETAAFNLGIYPLKDCGPLKVSFTDLSGPAGKIPASTLSARVARFKAMNTLGRESTYYVAPKFIDDLPANGLEIKTGITRSFYLTARVPEGTAPGVYKGQVRLAFANGTTDNLDLSLQVYPFTLKEPDFPFAIYGTAPMGAYLGFDPNSEDYWTEWKDIMRMCKAYGMTSLDPGINFPITKWQPEKADVDFAKADRFMQLAREAGYTTELFGYSVGTGFNLKISNADFDALAKRLGAPDYGALVKSYFNAVREHAEKNKWLPICYSTGDEFIARQGDPEKMAHLHEVLQSNAPGFHFGPSDSPLFGKGAENDAKMLKMLGTCDTWWASLHTQQIADAVNKAGRRLFLYNTGTSRYIGGTYMSYARHKYNVKGFVQWTWGSWGTYGPFYFGSHNEGCLGMVCPSTHGLRATPMFESMRSAATDHRYYETAFNLIDRAKKEGKAAAEAKELEDFIESIFGRLKFGNPNADALAAEGKADNPFKSPEALEQNRRKLAEGIIKLQSALK